MTEHCDLYTCKTWIRDATEQEIDEGRVCANCNKVYTEWDDTVYKCDYHRCKVGDGQTCQDFESV